MSWITRLIFLWILKLVTLRQTNFVNPFTNSVPHSVLPSFLVLLMLSLLSDHFVLLLAIFQLDRSNETLGKTWSFSLIFIITFGLDHVSSAHSAVSFRGKWRWKKQHCLEDWWRFFCGLEFEYEKGWLGRNYSAEVWCLKTPVNQSFRCV